MPPSRLFIRILMATLALALSSGILPGADRIRLGQGSARSGGENIPVVITATNDVPIQAFSLSIWFPPDMLSAREGTCAGTAIDPLQPEYINFTVDVEQGNAVLAVIFELSEPYDLTSLDPSPDTFHPIAAILFDVARTAGPGILSLNLEPSPHSYPIKNIFSSMGQTIFPTLENGTFEVLPPLFRRGFINPDKSLDISDVIFLFAHLYTGGDPPGCMAAADVNGDSRVDLSDGIWFLRWNFLGGPPPPEPFLTCGLDPRGPVPFPCEVQAVCP